MLTIYRKFMWTNVLCLCPCNALANGLGILLPLQYIMPCIQPWSIPNPSFFIFFHLYFALTMFYVAFLSWFPPDPQRLRTNMPSLSSWDHSRIHVKSFIILTPSAFCVASVSCVEVFRAFIISSWLNSMTVSALGTTLGYSAAMLLQCILFVLCPPNQRMGRSAKRFFSYLDMVYLRSQSVKGVLPIDAL